MKRIILIIIIVNMFIFFNQSYARSSKVLRLEQAYTDMKSNSNLLKNVVYNEEQAKRQYNDALVLSKDINTEEITIEIMGIKKFITVDEYTKIMLIRQKELIPEQMLYSFNMAQKRRLATENMLYTNLRDLFLGVYTSDSNFKIKQRELEVMEKINSADKIRFEKGLISHIEFEESKYNLLKAYKDLEAAKRNRENMMRSFCSFIKIPVDTNYDDVLIEEQGNDYTLKELIYYIKRALESRIEIISISEQIEIKDQEKRILEIKQVHQKYSDVKEEYNRIMLDLETLNIDLERNKANIENEIIDAYLDVKNAAKNIKDIQRVLQDQNRNYDKMKEKYKMGLITKNVLDKIGISIIEVENNLKIAEFNYHTKLIKLENASGIGPEY